MPITKSAAKAMRGAAKKRVYNLRRARAVSSAARDIEKLCAQAKPADAKKLLPAAYKAIDKAVKMGTLRQNTASRKKSRLAGLVKKADTK